MRMRKILRRHFFQSSNEILLRSQDGVLRRLGHAELDHAFGHDLDLLAGGRAINLPIPPSSANAISSVFQSQILDTRAQRSGKPVPTSNGHLDAGKSAKILSN
jgi:hypothetical protein